MNGSIYNRLMQLVYKNVKFDYNKIMGMNNL